MTLQDFLLRIPKTDLHLHIMGAIRPETMTVLAARYQLALPRSGAQLYDFSGFYEFLDTLRIAASALREADDFARVAYEALEDGHRKGNLCHAELLFNPQYSLSFGVSYRTMVDGLVAGIRAARQDFDVSALLVPSFDRQISPTDALEIMDMILQYRPPEIAGIGLDGAEHSGPPADFARVFARAGRHGLQRTAHVCEDNQSLDEAPPQNYAICCDVLGCDRLDHGYNLLADDTMTARAREDGLYFNTCTVTSVARNLVKRRASIATMVALGLKVTINTDDPAMFKTDIGRAYTLLFEENPHWGAEQAATFSLNGVDASWLGDTDRKALRQRFHAEIARLRGSLQPLNPPVSPDAGTGCSGPVQ